MTETELLAVFAILSPVILGAVEMLKMAGLPARYAPMLAVSLGMLIAPFIADLPIVYELIGGAMVGLSASGLWENGKALKAR